MLFALALSLEALTPQDGSVANRIEEAPLTKRLPACTFKDGAVLVERKVDLPPQVASELERVFRPIHGIAEAGEYFESTDVISNKAPQARFIRAYHVRDIWFVWYERGGIVLSTYTLALIPMTDGGSGEKVLRYAAGSGFQGDLCAGSKAFIAGARSM